MPVEAPKVSPTKKDGGSSGTQVGVAVADTPETDLIGVRFVPLDEKQGIDLPLPSINHFDPLGGRQIPQEKPRIPKYITIYPPPDFVMIESKDNEYGGDSVPDSTQTAAKSNNSDEEYPHDPDGFDVRGGDLD